jgi:hypothetical protein
MNCAITAPVVVKKPAKQKKSKTITMANPSLIEFN